MLDSPAHSGRGNNPTEFCRGRDEGKALAMGDVVESWVGEAGHVPTCATGLRTEMVLAAGKPIASISETSLSPAHPHLILSFSSWFSILMKKHMTKGHFEYFDGTSPTRTVTKNGFLLGNGTCVWWGEVRAGRLHALWLSSQTSLWQKSSNGSQQGCQLWGWHRTLAPQRVTPTKKSKWTGLCPVSGMVSYMGTGSFLSSFRSLYIASHSPQCPAAHTGTWRGRWKKLAFQQPKWSQFWGQWYTWTHALLPASPTQLSTSPRCQDQAVCFTCAVVNSRRHQVFTRLRPA